jgi:hypothetical protein
MTVATRRIGLVHAEDYPRDARIHIISLIIDMWEEAGIEVFHLYGTDTFEPADLMFVHVDRSLVPPEFRQFAERYPKTINAAANDIRKRTYADAQLTRRSQYDGAVIVKSNLNYAGVPEQSAEANSRDLIRRMRRRLGQTVPLLQKARMTSKSEYAIFQNLKEVPAKFFGPQFVVQKFQSEMHGNMYMLREYYFCLDLHYENIELSKHAIITEDENLSCQPFTPHPTLLALREKLGLDYGKIDYAMIDGQPFIYDANKTIGLGDSGTSNKYADDFKAMLRAFAERMVQEIA